jgi:hypothetical protein
MLISDHLDAPAFDDLPDSDYTQPESCKLPVCVA